MLFFFSLKNPILTPSLQIKNLTAWNNTCNLTRLHLSIIAIKRILITIKFPIKENIEQIGPTIFCIWGNPKESQRRPIFPITTTSRASFIRTTSRDIINKNIKKRVTVLRLILAYSNVNPPEIWRHTVYSNILIDYNKTQPKTQSERNNKISFYSTRFWTRTYFPDLEPHPIL